MRPTLPSFLIALTTLLAAAAIATPQDSGFDFYAGGRWRDGVPRPEAVLGYEIGTLHTTYGRLERYLEALRDAAPERIRIEQYGSSYEGRRLWLVAISSPRHLERLEAIRSSLGELADPASGAEEVERLVAETPVVVWLNYANDGNESAAFESALVTAYRLVAGEDAETRRFRERAVVLMTPAHNPESHERFVAWYNAFAIGDPDPLALEHNAPWGMDTNNNHYQIDLNRDAWPLSQRESQAIAAQVLRWRPQVFVDLHGQPDVYFFPPPAAPVNPSLPETSVRWLETFGRGNARAFDRYGWTYMVRENYDLYYPGYWDSWPTLHGATGMTYEVDGGGRKGLAWRREDGTIVTFRDAIAHHHVASIATVRTAVENREARLRDFHEFFRSAVEVPAGAARAYVFDIEDDPRRAAALATTLLRHGVEVRRLTEPFEAEGRSHLTGEVELRRFAAGSYLVDLAQPQRRIAETLLAADAELDADFARQQLARWARNARRGADEPKERYQFYDVTSWSLPFAFGAGAWALPAAPLAASEPLGLPADALATSGDWSDEVPLPLPGLRPGADHVIEGDDPSTDGRARTAYLFRPESEGALRLLAGLMREGLNVAVARRPLTAASQDFPRGTFLVYTSRNGPQLHERIEALAVDAAVEVFALDTAFHDRGEVGVGSRSIATLRAPRLGMLADEGISITSFGAAWFTLERRLAYPFTPLRFAQLRAADLGEFDVVAIPDASPGALARGLGEAGLEKLRAWLQAGGTLVAWGDAALWAADIGLVSTERVDPGAGRGDEERRQRLAEIDELVESADPAPPSLSPTADPFAPQPVPGAVLRARVDLGHWLAYGYRDAELPVLVRGNGFLRPSGPGANVIVFADDEPLPISGFVWPGNTEPALAGSAYAIVEGHGAGQVVLLTQDPNFRLAWRSTSRLFANALLLGASLR